MPDEPTPKTICPSVTAVLSARGVRRKDIVEGLPLSDVGIDEPFEFIDLAERLEKLLAVKIDRKALSGWKTCGDVAKTIHDPKVTGHVDP